MDANPVVLRYGKRQANGEYYFCVGSPFCVGFSAAECASIDAFEESCFYSKNGSLKRAGADGFQGSCFISRAVP
jgi:hypothetical protein